MCSQTELCSVVAMESFAVSRYACPHTFHTFEKLTCFLIFLNLYLVKIGGDIWWLCQYDATAIVQR